MSFVLLGILNSQAAGGAGAAQYKIVVNTSGRIFNHMASV